MSSRLFLCDGPKVKQLTSSNMFISNSSPTNTTVSNCDMGWVYDINSRSPHSQPVYLFAMIKIITY